MIKREDISKLARARIRDAEVLSSARRYDSAAYLCGYAIELGLKSRICKTLKWSEFPETNKEFQSLRSFKVHDLDVLLRLSGVEQKIKSKYLAEWSTVTSWKPENRYNPIGIVKKIDAEDMIDSAKVILKAL